MSKKRVTKKSGPARKRPKKTRVEAVKRAMLAQSSLRKVFSEIGVYKGLSNQDRFERIFTEDFHHPYWFLGIRKATLHEDHSEGTDFFVLTRNDGEIRFDVKSSFRYLEEQMEVQKTLPIFVWGIVIKPHISDQEIRSAVFKKCEIHIARLRRRNQI